MKLSKMFVTGCDSKTRWMVPWFLDNYHKHNPEVKIKVVDFQDGMGWLEKPGSGQGKAAWVISMSYLLAGGLRVIGPEEGVGWGTEMQKKVG